MNKFEEATSVHSYINPYDSKNPDKINLAYYRARGIPKSIKINKKMDNPDIAIRHN